LIPSIEQVVGVPVTLNGDLKNQFVETTVGFDTICKVGAAELTSISLDPAYAL
jgi:pyrophosphate--fructose-6-phosphate 1-phosphotransferase